MSIRNLFSALLIGTFAIPVFAADGVVAQDQQRIEQDKQNIKNDKQDLKTANEKVQQDKASGDVAGLKRDRKARREARRNLRQDVGRVHKDRAEKHHDVKNP